MTRLRADDIAAEAARQAGLCLGELSAPSRARDLARPRQRAMWAIRVLRPDISLARVGQLFGGRDHSTVWHACDAVERRRRADPAEAAACDALIAPLSDRASAAAAAWLEARADELEREAAALRARAVRSQPLRGLHA